MKSFKQLVYTLLPLRVGNLRQLLPPNRLPAIDLPLRRNEASAHNAQVSRPKWSINPGIKLGEVAHVSRASPTGDAPLLR